MTFYLQNIKLPNAISYKNEQSVIFYQTDSISGMDDHSEKRVLFECIKDR